MKKFLFLLLGMAVAVSASAGVSKTSLQNKVAKFNSSKVKTEQVVRKAAPGTVGTPYTGAINTLRGDVPEGYAMVTLVAGDVWEDGTGYQMLLDADATAYGSIFQATGGLTSSGDASAATYAEFEYKIPENADGSMSTQNIVFNSSVSILIPAGTYDYCITNPTPGDRIWIASGNGSIGGRYDDFVFESTFTYIFTVSLGGSNDQTDLEIINPNAPVVPEIAVTPASTSALVEWAADENATGYNLRWRPWTDTSSNPHEWNFTLEGYEADLDEGFWVYDADEDGNTWGLAYSSNAEDDICLYSFSWSSSTGGITPDNWIGTPDVPLKGELRFTVWGTSDNWPDTYMVYAMIGDEMTPLFDADQVTTATAKTVTVDLSQFNGEIGCIVFRHYNCTDMYAIYIDDIFIGDENDIILPADWTNVNGITDLNYTIDGLTPETKYEVQVMGYNDEFDGDWCDIVEFTTTEESAILIGDVDGDGTVGIGDVTTLIDYLLGTDVPVFIEDNANINGDDTISIGDVTALIDMLNNAE